MPVLVGGGKGLGMPLPFVQLLSGTCSTANGPGLKLVNGRTTGKRQKRAASA